MALTVSVPNGNEAPSHIDIRFAIRYLDIAPKNPPIPMARIEKKGIYMIFVGFSIILIEFKKKVKKYNDF